MRDPGVQWHPIPHSLLVWELSYKQKASCDIQSDTQLAVRWQWDTDWLDGFVPECKKTDPDYVFGVSQAEIFPLNIY